MTKLKEYFNVRDYFEYLNTFKEYCGYSLHVKGPKYIFSGLDVPLVPIEILINFDN